MNSIKKSNKIRNLFLNIIFLLGVILLSCSLPTDNDTIHYPNWQYGIFKINLDGTEKVMLKNDESVYDIQFIPNSENIVINKFNNVQGASSLFIFNPIDSTSLLISGEIQVHSGSIISISNTGEYILFWGIGDRLGTLWDLYLYDLSNDTITNLTNTNTIGEKDAIFIEYQDEEFILFSSYFDSLGTSYKAIELIGMDDNVRETLYCEELQNNSDYAFPIYDHINDILFVQSDYNNLLKISPLIDGTSTQVSNCSYHQMMLDIDKTLLFFKDVTIKSFNYTSNIINDIVSGSDFDYNGEVIVYTDSASDDASLYKIALDTSEITLLTDNCSIPNILYQGDEILYYGKYSE